MATFQGILTIIRLIPQLIALIGKFSEYVKKSKLEAWLSDLDQTIDHLEKAKTSQEKIDAAKRLADLTRRL